MNKKISYLILSIISIIILFSCLTSKKANRQLNSIEIKYPEKIATFARDKYPCSVLKSDTTYIINNDSVGYFKAQSDSLLKIKQHIKDSIAIRYKDSCRSVVDSYNEGFKLGYEVGMYDGRQKPVHDTFYIRARYEDSSKIKLEKIETAKAAAKNVELTKKINTKNTLLWVALALISLLGLGNYLQSKKVL